MDDHPSAIQTAAAAAGWRYRAKDGMDGIWMRTEFKEVWPTGQQCTLKKEKKPMTAPMGRKEKVVFEREDSNANPSQHIVTLKYRHKEFISTWENSVNALACAVRCRRSIATGTQ